MRTIVYNGKSIEVRGGAWNDIMNSWLFTVIDHIKGYKICQEREVDGGALFALEEY